VTASDSARGTAVYGLYASGQSAQEAVNRLRATGLADRDITILSAQPMEDFEFGHIDKRNWLWWIACGGGLLGMASAFGLTWITEMSWPINVGGLPIYAWWPNLIIIFELTMLGAILATVIGLVVTAGLGRSRGIYDPEVTDGNILVGVENPAADKFEELQKALESPAGARVKRLPTSGQDRR
jgi:ActD protein